MDNGRKVLIGFSSILAFSLALYGRSRSCLKFQSQLRLMTFILPFKCPRTDFGWRAALWGLLNFEK